MAPSLTRRPLGAAALGMALTARPAWASSQELRIGLAVTPTSMDPHFHANAANFGLHMHVFEALLQWGGDGRLAPMLARGWAPLPEGDGWLVELDPEACFADGAPVTARDAAASLDRAMTIPNSPGRFTVFLQNLRRAEAAGPRLLRLITEGPAPLLPNGLTTIMIMPARLTGATTAAFNVGDAVLGSGPFRLRRYRRAEDAELERNPGWWQAARQPRLDWDQLRIRFMPQDSARVAALLTGELDVIENLPPPDAPRLARTPGLRLVRQPGTRLMFLALNLDDPATADALRDRRVRQALSLALDRDALASQVMDGEAIPAAQIMPAGRPATHPGMRPGPADRAEAGRLLAEAGWDEAAGRPLRLRLLGTSDRFPLDERLLQAVAQMWRRVGVIADVEALPFAGFTPRYNAAQFGAALWGWLIGAGEPNAPLTVLLSTRDAARGRGALNVTGYANPRFDALVDAALLTIDPARRHALWQAATQLALGEDLALLPLLHLPSIWAMRGDLDYAPRADGLTLASRVHQAASR